MLQLIPDSRTRAGYNGGKRRKGSKVRGAVDTLGNLLAIVVVPTNEQGGAQIEELAKHVQEVTEQPLVPRGSKVRVTISVPSGSEIGPPNVHGPASVVVRNDITRLIDGHMPIGAMEIEFEMTTSGGGKVTLEVPVTFPGFSEPGFQEVTFLVE